MSEVSYSNVPQIQAQEPQSSVQQLLAKWRQEFSKSEFHNVGLDYHSVYHLSSSVTLANFGVLAGVALKLDGCDLSGTFSWRESPRLKEVARAWLEDSVSLNRPWPIAILNMGAELANLVEQREPSTSLTEVLSSFGLRSGTLVKMVRYQEVPFEAVAPVISSVNRILGDRFFPTDLETAWAALESLTDRVAKPLRERLVQRGYSTLDIAEIFQCMKPGLVRDSVSRTLTGETLHSGVSVGYLEALAHRDTVSLSAALVEQFTVAREIRQRKGRMDPHPSVLLRDVFGLSEECCAAFKPQAVLELESKSSYHLALVRATFREVAAGIVPVLREALSNRLQRELFIESNDFYDVVYRADQRQLLAKGVLGKTRMEDFLKGEYLPPLSQVKQLLGDIGVPAFLEVKYRILYADQNQDALNGVQRFVDALCEEHAESRNAFRTLHDSEDRPWKKISFERFFRALTGGTNEYRSHLLRVAEHASEASGRRQKMLLQISSSFADLLSQNIEPTYVECIRNVCRTHAETAAWLNRKLAMSLPVLRPSAPSSPSSPEVSIEEDLFNRVLNVTQSPDESEKSSAWKALRAVMRVLPGISLAELSQVALERDSVSVPSLPQRSWTPFEFGSIVSQAMGLSHQRMLERRADSRIHTSPIVSTFLKEAFKGDALSSEIGDDSAHLDSSGSLPTVDRSEGIRDIYQSGDMVLEAFEASDPLPAEFDSEAQSSLGEVSVTAIVEVLDREQGEVQVNEEARDETVEGVVFAAGVGDDRETSSFQVQDNAPPFSDSSIEGFDDVAVVSQELHDDGNSGVLAEEGEEGSAPELEMADAPEDEVINEPTQVLVNDDAFAEGGFQVPLSGPDESGLLAPNSEVGSDLGQPINGEDGARALKNEPTPSSKPKKSRSSSPRAKAASAEFDPDRDARIKEYMRRAAAGQPIFGEKNGE